MKKRLIATLLATAMFATAFTGCNNSGNADNTTKSETTTTTGGTTASGGDTTTASTTAALTTDEIELVVWESTGGPDSWIEQAGAEFTKLYPNIKIKFTNVELSDSSTQIATDGPAGVGADLFAAPHDKLGVLVAGEHILPTVNPDSLAVLDSCKTALTSDGVMYGYPTSAETYALFYNKDLIAKDDVPTTWEGVKTWAETFNAANSGKYGIVFVPGSIYYTIMFTTLNGNRLFGASGTDLSSSYLNTADAVTGMTFFQSLRNVLPVAAADMLTANADDAFAAGNAAMHITGAWNVKKFTDAGIKFGVTTLPSLPGEDKPCASFSGTRGMFVSAYSNHPAEAAAFATFLTSEAMQKLRYQITTALPVVDIELTSEYDQGFLAQLEYAFPMPSNAGMDQFWASCDSMASNIWDGADVKAELDAAEAAILAAIAG